MPASRLISQLSAASGLDVSRETFERVEAYVALLREGAKGQNLIAPSTFETIWERHILDSAQLVRFAPSQGATWADVGSGAGLPGIVIALLTAAPITLIEPRRLRADFLRETVAALGISARVFVEEVNAERATGPFDVITARAVASLDRLLALTQHLSKSETTWVLPKGRNAQSELAQARQSWQCDARVEQSCTDPDSGILVLTKVGAK